MKVLITGGAGFIGTNFVRYWLQNHPEDKISVLDKLTYAGRKENLQDILTKIKFIQGDICHKEIVSFAMEECKRVFHFAAESHVDRSISSAEDFVKTNLYGTYTLLEAAKEQIDFFIKHNPEKYAIQLKLKL